MSITKSFTAAPGRGRERPAVAEQRWNAHLWGVLAVLCASSHSAPAGPDSGADLGRRPIPSGGDR